MKVTPIGKKFGKYKPGDEFEFPDRAANMLIRIGKIRAVTREIVAEQIAEPVAVAPVAAAPRAKRTYRRRDIQAEA
jgi:hypothetical protein